ncbi:alpha/beta hydrolase [Georgenia subflava]|uniref:Alpha/beta hydrolase fold domain-containing protein n=1 Tax=Georgenia subflava TaxID=1622177 RepID=A0A6N7EFW4_9MICO|nr:alpha/beta hydrolase [Georgenia subflava]MPV36920.1 alpha/beta hydrolase fold domain-containing protein [Georgenia subflava]
MALPWRVRALGWTVRTVVGPYAKMSDAKRQVLQAHDGPRWVGGLINGRPDPAATATDITVPGPAGAIPARLYRPPGRHDGQRAPVVVVIAGGGFVFGHPEIIAWLASRLSTRLRAVVVVPRYRLAPEHPAPAAGEDCYAVTSWAAANAEPLGGDGERLAVVGESSGANLAAVVTLMARERHGPAIRAQGLLQGGFDLRPTAPAMTSQVTWPFGRASDARDTVPAYVGAHGDAADLLISPLLAPDHSGLPAAFVLTSDHDYLREDGERYAQALRAAGVPVEHAHFDDSPHGIFSFPAWCAASGPALDRLTEFLSRELAPVTAQGAADASG